MKTFKIDFQVLLDKLENNKPFAFVRFSDGEMFCLQSRKLELSERGTFVDNVLCGPVYGKEDFKEFIPERDTEFYNRLWASFRHIQHNYFVGISCPCCVGMTNFQEMKSVRNDIWTTWANLFVNSNYPTFVREFIPEFRKRKIVLICNEKADLSKSQLEIVKDFRIGRNAMINNINLHQEIGEWIIKENIEDHVFLFSASSLTNITIHELFKDFPKNTYMDIGTTLNPIFGFPASRGYLQAYWTGQDHPDLHKTCIWM